MVTAFRYGSPSLKHCVVYACNRDELENELRVYCNHMYPTINRANTHPNTRRFPLNVCKSDSGCGGGGTDGGDGASGSLLKTLSGYRTSLRLCREENIFFLNNTKGEKHVKRKKKRFMIPRLANMDPQRPWGHWTIEAMEIGPDVP